MSIPEDISNPELQQRVIYTMLAPAARLAAAFGVSLKDLRGLLDTAYFQALRADGLTHREIADALSVSERTTVKLSRQAREQFIAQAIVHSLPRRIEFMLGAEPMGAGRISQLLPEVDEADVQAALAQLIEARRVVEVPGRTLKFAPADEVRSLPRDTWMARVGGLNSFAENLTNAVYGRFFRQEPRTFARTLTFRGGPALFEALDDFYQQTLLPGLRALHRVREVDDAAENDLEAAQVSLCWAPYEYMDQQKDEDRS